MLITTESNVIASAGLQQTSNFQIAASAHAFRILSSGLYSDKIGAVLREIGCNAMDAHIAAGKADVPFEVHLPSRLTSKFYIRDFGPGLTHDEVLSLYTTYFSSSKQRSNDFTGAFGLGSKSPFSYTDSFTIVSVKNGLKTTYSAYVGDIGAPAVSTIAEAPADADWPSGMMISLPVRPQDYAEFQSKAQQIFRWFRVLPTMVNSPPITPLEYSVETSEFAIPKTEHGVCVVMGNVRYPVPSGEYEYYGEHQWAQHVHPVLRLPIGSVDVAASRENLEFTPKTRQTIHAALDRVGEHLSAEVTKTIKSFDLATLPGMRKANRWLQESAGKWGFAQFKSFLKSGGIDDEVMERIEDLTARNPAIKAPKEFQGVVRHYFVNSRGQLRLEEADYIANDRWSRTLPCSLDSKSAILQLGNTKYLKDRLRHALRHDYQNLFLVAEDDSKSAEIAKQWYDFPIVKGEDLPLPDGWVPPSKRTRAPRVPKFATASATMAQIDSTDGSVRYDDEFLLSDASDDQKFFVCPHVAWGNRSYYFGPNTRHSDYKDPIAKLARIAPHVSAIPRGIAVIKAGEVTQYKLTEKHGWRSVKELEELLLSSDVRDKVSTTEESEVGLVLDSGHCYETNSPLMFFASHAKANSKFWQAIRFRLPDSTILDDAKRIAEGTSAVSIAKPIPCRLYNDAIDVFGRRRDRIVATRAPDPSQTAYPTFQTCLNYHFPNELVVANTELAADLVARLIQADETTSTLSLAA